MTKKTRDSGHAPTKARAVLYRIEHAAVLMDTTPAALRALLRRHQVREGAEIVSRPGGGVRGLKVGRSWRVRFEDDDAR